MTPVRCSGCGRTIGVSPAPTPLRNKVYCNLACALDGDVAPEEERNDLWVALYDAGRSHRDIAAQFGVDRSRVSQVVRARRGPMVVQAVPS